MIKKICFFSVGFAFNRLVRMRYYEKIFPKGIKLFLFTTDKYAPAEEEREKWALKKTKVIVEKYHPIKTSFSLRRFCRENKIERLVNLGTPGAGIPFTIATLMSKTNYLIGFYGEIFKYPFVKDRKKALVNYINLPLYFVSTLLAKKITVGGPYSYKRAATFFLKNPKKVHFSHPSVNTDLFKQINKKKCRKKLNLSKDKKIIIRVGRINHGKCGDILMELVKKNPDILFITVGSWNEEEIPKIKAENLLHIEKKSSKELVEYYCASDLAFCMHRHGDQMGIVTEEALACGIPVIHSKELLMVSSPAVIKSDFSSNEASRKINEFLALDTQKKKSLSAKARKLVMDKFSDEVWKKRYVDFHLR